MDHGRQQSLGKRPAPDDRTSGARSVRHPRPKGPSGSSQMPPEVSSERGRPPPGHGLAGASSSGHSQSHARPSQPPGIPGAKIQSGGNLSGTGSRSGPPSNYARDRGPLGSSPHVRPSRDPGPNDASQSRGASTNKLSSSETLSQRHPPASALASASSDPRQVSKRPPEGPRLGAPVPGSKHSEDPASRAAAAKKAAVQHLKQVGATGNFKECDSLLGNYLIPAIPLHLAKK